MNNRITAFVKNRQAQALLAAIAIVIAAATISIVGRVTHERIARNELAWFQEQLQFVFKGVSYDNDPLSDHMTVVSSDLGTLQPLPVYVARKQGRAVAAALTVVAPDGYRGPITLLIGLDTDEHILGMRVLAHQETPGLGDAFAAPGSHWLDSFIGRFWQSPPQERWTVRKDGGDFDQFTGATITPRAILKAARNALEYVHGHHDQFFPAE